MGFWTYATRTQNMTESALRDLLAVSARPDIISFAGGLPAPQSFPIQALIDSSQAILERDGTSALQYGASEGYAPLRELIAQQLPWEVDPAQVLITTGSQQGLALIAQVLLDSGSPALVESPTYIGALQAFIPMQPRIIGVDSDEQGVVPEQLPQIAKNLDARFLYIQPNFQNPTGHSMGEARRQDLLQATQDLKLPLIEDNPYGDLWFDAPPPLPLSARAPERSIYLGSFSKVLAPGLRLGFTVAPKDVFAKLLQAKQGCDLHTPSWIQRIAADVLSGDFLIQHGTSLRQIYKTQRDAMLAALQKHMQHPDIHWNTPAGGMFIWLQLPAGLDTRQLLSSALKAGVAYVPGAAFYANATEAHTQTAQQRACLRLCYTTATVEQIEKGIKILAQVLHGALEKTPELKPSGATTCPTT